MAEPAPYLTQPQAPTPAATPAASAPKPPPPTTLGGKLRARLPSRGWMIFWTTFGTISGLLVRDHYRTVDARKRVIEKVDVIAKQPCGVHDLPRKVTIYITSPPGDGLHKTRHYFKEFVKPVLDGAALDYEVREAHGEGRIRTLVAADVRKKRQQAAGKAGVEVEVEEENKIPVKQIAESDGIIVLGRIALAEVLQGYNDGCLQSLEDPEPVVVAAAEDTTKEPAPVVMTEDTTTIKEAEQETSPTSGASVDNADIAAVETASLTENTAATTEEKPASTETATTSAPAKEEAKPVPVVIPQDESYFSLPPAGLEPVGYIPFKNLIGIKNWPKKFYALFNAWDCVEYAGAQVTKVAFAETRELTKDDLELGRDEEVLYKKYREPIDIEILDRVRDNVKIYITPTHLEKPAESQADNESKPLTQ
ncbi:mitochondrial import inner membrane translocase subunit tim54 [Actinomortierella ambigua]|nr:mitochondrial import inner membrane translocase subunit tim54 [Actinomortierella ambigua]